MTDDITLALAVGLVAGVLAFACLRKSRGSRTWGQPVDLDVAREAVAAEPVPPGKPRSYIIPVTCGHYTRCAWYVCGTTEEIIEHLWLKRDPVSYHFEEDDGA